MFLRKVMLIICFLFVSCKDFNGIFGERHDTFTIFSNTSDSVKVYFASSKSSAQYPDTSLPVEVIDFMFQTLTNSKPAVHGDAGSLEYHFDTLPSDTMSVFFIDAKLFADSPWTYVRDSYAVLMRYDLSLENVQALERLYYPPTPEMRSTIKMYP